MDAPRSAVRLAVLGAVAALGMLVVLSATDGGPGPQAPVKSKDGSPFVVPRTEGAYEATWGPREDLVLVVVTRQAVLDGVEQARGEGQATQAQPLGDGLAVFVASARSARNGCSGVFRADLGASNDIADYDGDQRGDGRFMESCHHGQWDLFNRGEPVPATPTCGRLPMLPVELRDGVLWSTGFDAPTRC